MKEYGLGFPVSGPLMVLQEASLLHALNRRKDALELLSRAGYASEPTGTAAVSTLEARLRTLAAQIAGGACWGVVWCYPCIVMPSGSLHVGLLAGRRVRGGSGRA